MLASPMSRQNLQGKWATNIVVLIICAVLATAVIAKFQNFGELESTLAASQLVPMDLVRVAARVLIAVETAVALSIVVPSLRTAALRASMLLFGVFASYSIWRWMLGIAVPCHCFGTLFTLEPWQSFVLNVALLCLAAYVVSERYVRSRLTKLQQQSLSAQHPD